MAAANKVADMTVEELQELIGRMIDSRLKGWPEQTQRIGQATPETWQAILDDIINPAPNEPTALELLREERDQWYKNT